MRCIDIVYRVHKIRPAQHYIIIIIIIIIIINITTHADDSCVSITIIHLCDSVCEFVCLSVCLSVRTIKPKRLKVKSPNLIMAQR